MTYRLITYLLLAGFSQSVFAVGLSFSETQHLLTRTGFTPSFFEVTAIQGQKKTDAVQAILDSAQHPDGLQADGAFTEITKPLGRSATQSERDMYRQMQRESVLAMQQWWLGQMLTTQTPFAEQLIHSKLRKQCHPNRKCAVSFEKIQIELCERNELC